MSNYFKRKNGNYCIRISNGRVAGKQKYITTTYYPPEGLSDKEEEYAVNEYANLFERAIRNGYYTKEASQLANLKTMTLNDFIKKHYYNRIDLYLSPKTVEFYKSVIEQCLIPSFGNVKIKDISSRHLQSFVDYLSSHGSRYDQSNKDPLSGSTIKRYSTVFRSVMNEAYRDGMVEKDVFNKSYIIFPKVQKQTFQAYDSEEAKKFFDCLSSEPIKTKALLSTSLLLGLRRGEVIGLMWSDIDFENCCLKVARSAYKIKNQPQTVKSPKSSSSVRTVFFSEKYAEILKCWKENQLYQKKLAGDAWKDQDFVFTNDDGSMMSINAPTRMCSKFESKNGLRHLKLHGLRHTCGSLMIKNGVDIETVKSMFGHESIKTTQQYLSAYDSSKRTAAVTLADAIIG